MNATRVTLFGSMLALIALFSVGGCSSDDKRNHISASDYDQSCKLDSDCVVAYVGDCDCTCDWDYINKKDQARFESDLKSCSGYGTCGACPWSPADPWCNAGKCDGKVVTDAGSDANTDAASD